MNLSKDSFSCLLDALNDFFQKPWVSDFYAGNIFERTLMFCIIFNIRVSFFIFFNLVTINYRLGLCNFVALFNLLYSSIIFLKLFFPSLPKPRIYYNIIPPALLPWTVLNLFYFDYFAVGSREAGKLLERFVIATVYLQNESVVLHLQNSMKTTMQLKHGHPLIHI